MPESEPAKPTFAHRAEFLVVRIAEGFVSSLSMEACAVLGRLLGGAFQFLSPRYRRLIRRNLRIATANTAPDSATLDSLVRETFQRSGANFLTSLKSALMTPEALACLVVSEGLHHLDRERSANRGLVVAMPHMGNWEAMSKIGSLFVGKSPFGGIYRPLNNPLLDQLTFQRRTADGARAFNRADGFHAPIALLRAPGSLAVLADQRAGGRGTPLPFFGKLASCSPLPDLMARRAKTDVASLSIISLADGFWKVRMKLLGSSPGSEAIMAEIEKSMRASLTDVFWFHDRWRTDATRPLSFYTAIAPTSFQHVSVPLRVLLTTPEAETEGPLALIRRMLDSRPDLRIDWLGAPLESHPDPRVVIHPWDHSAPSEHAGSILSAIDSAHPAPLDAALLFGGSRPLATAAKRLGVRAILGLAQSGKPWTRSFPAPASPADWEIIAREIAYIPPTPKA